MSEPVAEGPAAAGEPAQEPSTSGNSDAPAGESTAARNRRRRGSRGGRNRNRSGTSNRTGAGENDGAADNDGGAENGDRQPELPDRPMEGRPQSIEAAERALVRKPQIGDSRPAPDAPTSSQAPSSPSGRGPATTEGDGTPKRRRRRGG